MRFGFITALGIAFLLGAAPPNNSPPPPPARLLFDHTLTGQPRAWDRIQDPIDRSTGRITDESTHELNHIDFLQREQSGHVTPQQQFDEYQADRERQLRIDQRAQSQKPPTREDVDRREYELFLNAGLSSTALQTQADEQALMNAQSHRDQQLIAADNDHDKDYAQRVQQIRAEYERERERILGFAPTTQP